MPAQQVLVINGPAGVGKTTIAHALQIRLPGTIRIAGDDLRHFAPDDAAAFLGKGSTYRAGATLTNAYLGMGAPRVIFEYVFQTPAQIELFRQGLVPGLDMRVFTLWAPLEEVSRREATRPGRARLGGQVPETHAALAANLDRLGTGIVNVAEIDVVVERILSLLEAS